MAGEIESGSVEAQGHSPEFLRLFYPFHYIVGEAMEGALQGAELTHHEAVILWMIHSEGGDEGRLPRKEIERLIGDWYELGSPAVTKVLKKMASRPKPFLTIGDSEHSGREKIVKLTADGRSEIRRMMTRANAMIDRIIVGWTDSEIEGGLHFLRQVVERVEHIKRSSLP